MPPESQVLGPQGSIFFDLPTFMNDMPMPAEQPEAYPQTTSPMDLNLGGPSATVSPNMLQNGQTPAQSDTLAGQHIVDVPTYRPQSAQSHHSHQSHHSYRSHANSVSGSEFSYSSTDVSEDFEMDDPTMAAARGSNTDGLQQLDFERMGLGTAGAAAYVGGQSPVTPGPSTGLGAIQVASEEEQRRRAKLEREWSCCPFVFLMNQANLLSAFADRRQINRKSAQKHRQRRREESETLNRAIAERDAKIAQLEKDLAVERARLQQLMSFVRTAKGRALDAGQGDHADEPKTASAAGTQGDDRELGKRRSMRLKGSVSVLETPH